MCTDSRYLNKLEELLFIARSLSYTLIHQAHTYTYRLYKMQENLIVRFSKIQGITIIANTSNSNNSKHIRQKTSCTYTIIKYHNKLIEKWKT